MFGTFGNGGQWDKSVTINANLYTNFVFDVLVSSNCPVNANGDYGQFQMGFVDDANGYIWVGTASIPAAASNHWVHCVVPIPKTLSQDITAVYGIGIQMTSWWSTDPSEPPTTATKYWVDNLVVEITPGPPPPPPTLLSATMKKVVGGVNCIAVDSGSGAIDNRYNIVTTNTVGYGPNSGSTVTYSWKIASFANDPDGFQGHFMISCGADSSGIPNGNGGPGQYDSSVDWNWGDVILVTIQANSGGAYMNCRFKTNAPASNTQLWATNYASVSSSSPIGTWSVSFNKSSGLVTLTSPQNSTNFTWMPPRLRGLPTRWP